MSFDNWKNIIVSEGSLTLVQGNSITYARCPTNNLAGIQASKTLHDNIAAGAMHNSKERYNAPKCHPDTRIAVLNDITSWILDRSKKTSILWLSAPAGSGKSAILQQISENFYKSGGLSATFFFSRSVAKRNTDTYLVATLASQLATSVPATRPFIEEAIERDPSIFQRVLSEQMDHLVVYPLVSASLQPENGSPWPTLLVIDGLDECNGVEHQAHILRVLRRALLQLKFFLPTLCLLIASRSELAITTVFDYELSDITRRIILDDNYDPDRDIAIFLRSSFADIYRRRHALFPSMAPLPPPPEHVISFLVRKSSGQFIFAATVIRFIDVDRKSPSAQLQLILDICGSMDSSRFSVNPFALLDDLYSHVLRSSEETERAISILGAVFYLNGNQSPTLDFLLALLRLKLEDLTMIFWDLHSIVHVPASDKDPIRFHHASLRDFLMDRHRSGDLHVDGSKAHSFLLKSCIQALSDFHGGSTQERTHVLRYSRDSWKTHYNHGYKLDPGILDNILRELNPETWLALDNPADAVAFVSWWNDFAPLRECFHGQCGSGQCLPLCFRYSSIIDRYLVHRFQNHENPIVVAALMWLTLLSAARWESEHVWPYAIPRRQAESLWKIPAAMDDKDQFFSILTRFLTTHSRSNNLFLGSVISTAHFTQVCAQRAWRGILALDRPYGSENWRRLIHLYDVLNVLIPGDAPYRRSSEIMNETIVQDIQMRIDDLAGFVNFVEATRPQEQGPFRDQVLLWRDIVRTQGTSPIDSTTASQDEVGTSRSQGKPPPSSNKGRKRREAVTEYYLEIRGLLC